MSWHARALTPNASSTFTAGRGRPSRRALALPLVCTLSLLAFAALPPVQQHARLLWSIAGAAAILLGWIAVLALLPSSRRTFGLDIALRPQHYVQACAHLSILVYWGWHWRPVYDVAYLIVAQVLFAYAFDALLAWSRGERFTLGFGPLPIVFSTNLFLWFEADWFFLQFLMIAVGFTAKALIRWHRDGRQTHIFNPSSFTLALFSLALLATGTSGITLGQEIAVTQFFPPHMYAFLFLVALPGQVLFGVTTMTMAAVVTTYGFGLVYFALTGTYYFFDAYIPIAVFLGMHLLFTDPSTAPRTEGGRIVFGALYGLSTLGLYAWLGAAGYPTFYDKLLQVPLLNLSVRAIDRAVRSRPLARLDPGRAWPALAGRRRHLAYVSLWSMVFAAMTAAGGVGDDHPGQWLPFWQQACTEGRAGACRHLSEMYATYCRAGSPWSCREFESMGASGAAWRSVDADVPHRAAPGDASGGVRALPPIDELPILLRGSKGPIVGSSAASLRARACAQGWPGSCPPPAPGGSAAVSRR
ncbi:MAG TPA: hypothetical protein VM032_13720 [Vicinamibacterales bacterium]|nr:hypothetical protein [Vicinamibacterales bacterium]